MRYEMSYFTLIILTILALLCAAIAHGAKPYYTGEVVRIIDGDTIHVREYGNKKLHKVRLGGIDAPELDQPYGQNAKAALNAILKYHTVQVNVLEKDIYQREIATVLDKGADIAAFMLQYGYAWHYKSFNSSIEYTRLEQLAKAQGLGLWSLEHNIPPWLWRSWIRHHKQ